MKIKDFEQYYMKKFWEYQLYQWENYACNANHNLSEIDNEIFKIVKLVKNNIETLNQKGEIFYSILYRELVDRAPEVSRLRNRLDNWDNYSHGLSKKQTLTRIHYLSILAKRMKPDVLALMKTRNRLAEELGFSSYPDMVFSTEGIEIKTLITMLKCYLKKNLPIAKKIIKKHQISWENWFSDLYKIGSIEQNLSSTLVANKLLDNLDIKELKNKIQIILKEQQILGYTGIISIPDDIRILLKPINSLFGLLTLFHELGHAVTHSLNSSDGLFKTWSAVYDESMAVLIEHIATIMFLSKDNQKAASEIFVLENTRCAVSALFEFSLWGSPDDAENLYSQYYGKLGVKISNPSLWAIDPFRSIDAVYIHNYVIGMFVAEATIDFLSNLYEHNFQMWGKWLRNNYFTDGRKRSLWKKMESNNIPFKTGKGIECIDNKTKKHSRNWIN